MKIKKSMFRFVTTKIIQHKNEEFMFTISILQHIMAHIPLKIFCRNKIFKWSLARSPLFSVFKYQKSYRSDWCGLKEGKIKQYLTSCLQ